LKNRIVRHVSRRPNPKATGPRVPAENLLMDGIDISIEGNMAHERMLKFIENQTKNILL